MTADQDLRFRLSDLTGAVIRDGRFNQTNFSGSPMAGTLCFVTSGRYLKEANANPNVTAVIAGPSFADKVREDAALAVSDDPMRAFYELHNDLAHDHQMAPEMPFERAGSAVVHPSAVVDEKSFVGEGVSIGAGAVVEAYSYLADGVVVGPGAVIGCAGHFFKRFDDGLFRVAHAGGVRIEHKAEVLAGAVVSRAVHPDFTVVGEESVVSVRAHIGHGCRIGARTIVAGSAQVSGYTTIGENVWIGPSAVIGNLLTIGDGAHVELGAAVVQNLAPGQRVSGNFAYDHVRHLRDNARNRAR